MPITLARVDDRVIHGQIITRWSKARTCNGILVVNDGIAKDAFRSKVLKAAAPEGVKVGIYTLQEGAERVAKAKLAKNGYFVISNSPMDFQKLLEIGVDWGNELIVGPMSAKPDAVTIGKNVSVTEQEKEAFDFIQSKNVNIIFQLTPDETPVKWEKIRLKYS